MHENSLKEILKGEYLNYCSDYNLNIEKIKIQKKEMEATIFLKAKKFINNKIYKELLGLFSKSLLNFNIELKVKYPLDETEEGFFLDYKNYIKDIILENIPSSSSWISQLEFNLKEDQLKLIFPNQLALISLERNNFLAFIETKVLSDTNLLLHWTYNEEEIVSSSDFLEFKRSEEEEISKDIFINSEKADKIRPKNKNFKYGKNFKRASVKINEATINSGNISLEGKIFNMESREIKGNRYLITIFIYDETDSIEVKAFLTKDEFNNFNKNLTIGESIVVNGDITYDNFSNSQVLMLKSLIKKEEEERIDSSVEKRVELHLHTRMSSLDGITDLEALTKRAKEWGHNAIAITDHGVVQAYPEAMSLSKQYGIKFIYGLEAYLVDDKKDIVINYDKNKEYKDFVIFDIETTGLSAINDEITEIGAVKIKDGKIIDKFSQLVNPNREIPEKITNLTGITNEMVKNKPFIDEVIFKFKEFIGESTLVAHNASFDVGFIREKFNKNNILLNNPIIDTLQLSRLVFPNLKNHKLDTIARHLDIELINHHRAVDDAIATSGIFLKILALLKKKKIKTFDQINNLKADKGISRERAFHIVLLAKNSQGLKNIYKLVSESHINHFYRNPRIPKSLLETYRQGIIVGSACQAGELYRGIISNKSYSEIRDIVNFYDYLEIQAIGNNEHLIREGLVRDEVQIEEINKQIYNLGKKYDKPVVATGDVHFLDPDDKIFRTILMTSQKNKDADIQAPLYFKTTDEMLKDFEYFGEDIAYELVVKNTNLINDMIEDINPIPEGTYPPIIEGSEEELKKISYDRAYLRYGKPLPKIVENRLKKELDSIIKNGYAVMYIIAQKLVWQSNVDGYLVGSRGSVGSSFAATMSGITEVNPLPPHYICPECKFSEFFIKGEISSGTDLEDKDCPQCGFSLEKDGQDIPFESFLGFEGDKEPDIDLNFAGEYQMIAHKFIEELFGSDYVYRAGTIGTIAEKTAYGFVRKYLEKKGRNVNPAEINRLIKGCTGIKRTSGQHPGGVMIVPKNKDILDFTPIQYPANDSDSGVITTHFDYNAISGRILKLDILGHDVPSIIRMLEEITSVNSETIPLDEPKTMKIFNSISSLGINEEDINCKVGTLGIPEFGTKFVRQMLIDTEPKNFSDLVRISGLSHGTDVWINNAQDLIRQGKAELSEVISTREDIMLSLIKAGLEKKKSFQVMEKVRRGKGLSLNDENDMKKLNLPGWYIESCNKIKYMFPKAHAVAYVMMSFRIAYFKVYYPLAFYAAYFSTKANDFDGQLILSGQDTVIARIRELETFSNKASEKEKNLLTVLEVVREMYSRGYKFKKVDLYKSHSDKFLIEDGSILPPLKALVGVGENAARKILLEREISQFMSVEDLIKRCKVTKTVIEALDIHGCLKGMPESNQLSIFNI